MRGKTRGEEGRKKGRFGGVLEGFGRWREEEREGRGTPGQGALVAASLESAGVRRRWVASPIGGWMDRWIELWSTGWQHRRLLGGEFK